MVRVFSTLIFVSFSQRFGKQPTHCETVEINVDSKEKKSLINRICLWMKERRGVTAFQVFLVKFYLTCLCVFWLHIYGGSRWIKRLKMKKNQKKCNNLYKRKISGEILQQDCIEFTFFFIRTEYKSMYVYRFDARI